MIRKIYIILVLGLLSTNFAHGQKKEERPTVTRILFVFDGSQSMYARWESGRKIDIAQRLITKMLDSLQSLDNRSFQLALRVYGHQRPVPPQDCDDTRLEVPFKDGNFQRIKKVLRSIRPKGTTPIARSLMRAESDFPPCENCRNVIILITDGVEACDEDPCDASRYLQKKGIALKPFVIGIGLDKNFKETFDCIGTFFDANNEDTFEDVLGVVISQALDNTTAQVNLLDGNELPTETNIAISFYNMISGKVDQQIVHTLNYLGNPDTIYLDPLVLYSMTVHSIPERHLDSIRISAGTHNEIGISIPRGKLELKTSQRNEYPNLQAIIREAGKKEILHIQDFNTTAKYLSGTYDVEILSLPRYREEGVEIKPAQTTTLGIPPPGVLNISGSSPGYGSILIEKGKRLEWVIDLNERTSRQTITLQPGNYRLVYRSRSSRESEYSVSKKFNISSGTTTIVKLN